MKQFSTILKFELWGYLKNKIFVGITVFLALLIAVIMFFPRITEAISSDNGAVSEENVDTENGGDTSVGAVDSENDRIMLISAEENDVQHLIESAFSEAFTDYDVQLSDKNIDDIKASVTGGEAECAFVFDSLTSYTYYVDNLSMYDSNTEIADTLLENVCRMNAMLEAGIEPDEAASLMSIQIENETVSLGKDQMQNFFYTYIMIFALYMVILLYGQMVSTNVATEKSSRAMEVLITSASPTSMMFGKVIASCIAGLLQLIAVFGSAVLFYNLNLSYWSDNMIIASIFDMPLSLLGYMLLFFILGFFIYAFMFGAIGSTASKLEDINTSVMPVTLVFIASFIIVMYSMSSGSVDSTLMTVCSFVPFTSPMAMFTRIAMSTEPLWQIITSAVILVASASLIGVIAAKIYRVGVLMYGTSPKPSAIIKAIKNA